mmetsp:Transcript_14413/g.27704  ORF Transcript_14413/g.27704 Transcript_14413/m.27704 type:complete len:265 (-) Transcript_14413:953-1747(-)
MDAVLASVVLRDSASMALALSLPLHMPLLMSPEMRAASCTLPSGGGAAAADRALSRGRSIAGTCRLAGFFRMKMSSSVQVRNLKCTSASEVALAAVRSSLADLNARPRSASISNMASSSIASASSSSLSSSLVASLAFFAAALGFLLGGGFAASSSSLSSSSDDWPTSSSTLSPSLSSPSISNTSSSSSSSESSSPPLPLPRRSPLRRAFWRVLPRSNTRSMSCTPVQVSESHQARKSRSTASLRPAEGCAASVKSTSVRTSMG